MACLACWIGDRPGAVNVRTCQMLAGSTSWPSIRQMTLSLVCTPTRSGASSSTCEGRRPAIRAPSRRMMQRKATRSFWKRNSSLCSNRTPLTMRMKYLSMAPKAMYSAPLAAAGMNGSV